MRNERHPVSRRALLQSGLFGSSVLLCNRLGLAATLPSVGSANKPALTAKAKAVIQIWIVGRSGAPGHVRPQA